MTDHEKRIREALEADRLYPWLVNVNPADLRTLLADLDEARAALTAAKAGGWVAVPVEPTQAMLDALHSSAYLPGCYRAMLAAAQAKGGE